MSITGTQARALFRARKRIAGAVVRNGTGIASDDAVYAKGFEEAQRRARIELDVALRVLLAVEDTFNLDAIEDSLLATEQGG